MKLSTVSYRHGCDFLCYIIQQRDLSIQDCNGVARSLQLLLLLASATPMGSVAVWRTAYFAHVLLIVAMFWRGYALQRLANKGTR